MKSISIHKYVNCTLIVVMLISILSPACKKTPDCGCDSPTTETVINIPGALNYYYTVKNEISIVSGSPGLLTVFVICDTSDAALRSILKPKRDSVYQVNFSGIVKKFCPEAGVAYLDVQKAIQLTSITPR